MASEVVHDTLSSGRSYKMLTVLDELTRQALAVTIRTRMGADDILEALYPLLLKHSTPEYIRSELPIDGAIGSSPMGDGPECASEALQDWLRRVGIKPIRISPGSPWENGYNERFNGTYAGKVSMRTGSQQRSKRRSSSIIGSDNTTTPARIPRL